MKFDQATIKLTTIYVIILLIISSFFSAILYRVSIQEIDRSFQRQTEIINKSPRLRQLTLDPDFTEIRQEAYDRATQKLLLNIFTINLLVLLFGGLLSYFFAVKTLKPIEEAHESQSRFTADASHELRTPISVMQSEIEVALRDKKLSLKDAKELLNSNLEEVGKLTILINSLLQLSKLNEEKVEIQNSKITKLVADASKNVKSISELKDIEIEKNVGSKTVRTNSAYATQIITIILDNAIKYSPKSTKVIIDEKVQNSRVLLSITDQGPGIKDEDRNHIFNRFYRADNSRSKQNTEGVGLGLAIAKELASKIDAEIDLVASSNKGSKFQISFPKA